MKTFTASHIVPDHVVRAAIARARVLLTDGVVPVEARFLRWIRTPSGQLAALTKNPLNHNRVIVGIDNRTGRVRPLARA